MARIIHSRQEKKKLYKKLALTLGAVLVFCIAIAVIFQAIDRQKLREQEAYEAELGVVVINGKNIYRRKILKRIFLWELIRWIRYRKRKRLRRLASK